MRAEVLTSEIPIARSVRVDAAERARVVGADIELPAARAAITLPPAWQRLEARQRGIGPTHPLPTIAAGTFTPRCVAKFGGAAKSEAKSG